MTEDKYFREALTNFISETAFGGAVRHLYDLGYSVEKIQEELSYPASREQICRVIEEYEKKKKDPAEDYDFVRDVDAYGRKSFRKVRKREE